MGWKDDPLVEEAPAPTAGERGRAGLAGVNRGIAGLVGLPVDTVENIINLALAAYGTGATALGKPEAAPDLIKGAVGGSEHIAKLMEGAGVETKNPRPDDPASRMLHTGGVIAVGSMVPGATAKGTLAAATGGAVAAETLGPEWTGVGALAPAAASQAASAVKNAVASRVAPNVETFKQAGATPTVGQATRLSFIEGLENLAAKFPGGAGVMRRFIESQQASLGGKAKTGVSAEEAGRAIEQGVRGSGGFLERSKATWRQLDSELAAKIPPASRFAPTNTVQALDDLTRQVPTAEKTLSGMANQQLAQWKQNVADDMAANNGQMSYEAIRAIRSRVGEKLDDSLVSGIGGGELKKLYGALTKDMRVAAQQAGAEPEFNRQNQFWSARMSRVEDVLERVIGKGRQPEDIFKAFMPKEPDQANKARAVMRSLDPSQRKVVTDAVVNRLGRASPGKQDEFGEVFSSETFLTNWNKLSEGAKSQIFPNHATRQNVEAISKAAANIREGSKLYANPSGTAGSFAAYSVYSSPMIALGAGLAGGPTAAAGVLGAAAGAAGTAYVGAKMLTSPKVVEWLARPVSPSRPGEAQAHLARLAVIYNETKDEVLKGELERFIASTQ